MALFPDIERLRTEGPQRIAAGAATGQRMFDKYMGRTGTAPSADYSGAMAGLFSRARQQAGQGLSARMSESQLRADLQKDKLEALYDQLRAQKKAAKGSKQAGILGTVAGFGGSLLGSLWPQQQSQQAGLPSYAGAAPSSGFWGSMSSYFR